MSTKILHIIDSGGLYGAERMLLNLIDEQTKLGMIPTLCSIGAIDIEEKPIETEALRRGFHVRKFRMKSGPNIIGALKILQFAHEKHFNLIHTHGYKGDILLGSIPKRVRKLPLVATLHGWTSVEGFSRMKIYEWLDLKSLKYFEAVVLVNKAMLALPKIKNSKIRNISIINNGISAVDIQSLDSPDTSSQICSIDKKIRDFCRDGFIVGAIGRLSFEKGFEYLIDAIYKLRKDIKLKLIVIGDGPLKEKLQAKINEMDLLDSVYMAGYLAHGCKYMRHFDVFVLPSLSEGLPITLLEAMQGQIPIVASKVGGIPEVLQNGLGGLLAEPADSESLARAIKNIYDNRDRARQAAVFSYEEVNKKYTSRAMALQYCNVYRKAEKCFYSGAKTRSNEF